ncbi:hypothetical protein EMPG_16110 [Blastomyces silverae]|uniref:Uncharacterized protein n=1 Tax=Blastomyces silverae TaxID=2060906 RepID=A0A0H1BGZ9_9EURO|nr:hypothetical protein EMPG_16110 [Blastomyces silverae]
MEHRWRARMRIRGENQCPHHLRRLHRGGVDLEPARGHLQLTQTKVLFRTDHHLRLLEDGGQRQNIPGNPIPKRGKTWALLKKHRGDLQLGKRERAKHSPLLEPQPPPKFYLLHQNTRFETRAFSLTIIPSRVEALR